MQQLVRKRRGNSATHVGTMAGNNGDVLPAAGLVGNDPAVVRVVARFA